MKEGPREPVGSVQVGLDAGVWKEALTFDPLTGRSGRAESTIEGDRVWIRMDVRDYPLLILAP